jgi:hypothetical protein
MQLVRNEVQKATAEEKQHPDDALDSVSARFSARLLQPSGGYPKVSSLLSLSK